MGGRSIADDIKTDLEAQSWVNYGSTPKIKIGGRYGRLTGNFGVIVHEGEESTEEHMTFAHTVIARKQEGIIELWHKNNADRQKMTDDIETILHSNETSYDWKIIDIRRENMKNTLYNAEIIVERLL